jgi:predicted KAP-like P-loop ATPase
MLAHAVLRGSPPDGLVVGVFGEWGLGKTTVLSFVEHYLLADADDVEPLIVKFNPWWFSGREDLVRRFFTEFEAAALSSKAKLTKLRSALEKLGGAVAAFPSTWTGAVGKLMVAAAAFGKPGDVVALKKNVETALREQPLRIIVLVDDIDRLPPADIIEVFRLVKAVGDLPNVFYVLAFDRRVVANALRAEYGDEFGSKYLDKIIQVTFDIPPPNKTTLEKLLRTRLGSAIGASPPDLYDEGHWAAVYTEGLARLLRTPRDVLRLANVVSVTYPALRHEVNPVDFVAIEALRLFVPHAYTVVRECPEKFVGWAVAVARQVDEPGEALKAFHQKWLDGCGERTAGVRHIMAALFPGIAPMFGMNHGNPGSELEWRAMRRVCSEEVFDAYFRYSLEGDLGLAEFRASLARVALPGGGAVLHTLAGTAVAEGVSKLRRFLDLLRDDLLSGREVPSPAAVVAALCTVEDTTIAQAQLGSLLISDDLLLAFVVQDLLRRLPEVARVDTLTSALDAAGVASSARIITAIGAAHGRYGENARAEDEHAIPRSEDVDRLEAYARGRIRRALEEATFWSAPRLPMLLFHWARIDGDAPVRDAVGKWTEDDLNFSELLAQLVAVVIKGVGGRTITRAVINLKAIRRLFDLEVAAERARRLLLAEGWSERHRDALTKLVSAYDGLKSGKRDPLDDF